MNEGSQRREEEQLLPVSFEGWQLAAEKVLDEANFNFIKTAAGVGNSEKANLEAFYRYRLVPRVLRDVSNRDTSVNLFGSRLSIPVLIAPMGRRASVHPDGELAMGRAAATSGIGVVLSEGSSFTMEDVAKVMGDSCRWLQLSCAAAWNDEAAREVITSLVRRAESSGFSAIVITVDNIANYPRYSYNERLGKDWLVAAQGLGMTINYTSDPVFVREAKRLGQDGDRRLWDMIHEAHNLRWEDLEFLRRETKLPVLLKGVLNPKDAELAVEHRVDGIIVSNHGGRVLDGSIASLDALPAVRDAVSGRIPILLDSGVRTGSDVVKALALGAKAVLLGRSFSYGLAVAGERGVRAVAENLALEIERALALCGCRSIEELDDSILVRAPP